MNKIFCPVAAQRDTGSRQMLDHVLDNTTDEDRERRDLSKGDRYNRIECAAITCTVRAILTLSNDGRVAASEVIDPASCARGEQPQESSSIITFHAD